MAISSLRASDPGASLDDIGVDGQGRVTLSAHEEVPLHVALREDTERPGRDRRDSVEHGGRVRRVERLLQHGQLLLPIMQMLRHLRGWEGYK